MTPEHLAALLDDPWDGTGPLRIATDLSPEEVEPFFGAHNAALLLQVLLEEGSARLWHALDIFMLPLLCDFGVLAMKRLGPGPPGMNPHSYRPGPLARRMLSWRFEETP